MGRTLALANMAIYLSRFGQNVCVMDFDLEAPGLLYKFGDRIDPRKIQKGLVDYIYESSRADKLSESLAEYSVRIPQEPDNGSGEIWLIPAGNVLSSDYWKRLALIDWRKLLYDKGAEGIALFVDLKERIAAELKPDFLLIDSRTGVTEMSGICTSLLADKVVFLLINNRENVEGTARILQGVRRAERLPGQKPVQVTFALTRVPVPEKERDKEILEDIVKSIRDRLMRLEDDMSRGKTYHEISILHSDRELELVESLRVAPEGLATSPFLADDYLALFGRIIPDEVVYPKIESIVGKIMDSENLLRDPDRAQQELESVVTTYKHPRALEKLIELYFLRNVSTVKIAERFRQLLQLAPTLSLDMLSKYATLFMKAEMPDFNTRIFDADTIGRYVASSPKDRPMVEKKLADFYFNSGQYDRATLHYKSVMDQGGLARNELVKPLVLALMATKNYDKAAEVVRENRDLVDADATLRAKEAELLFRMGDKEGIARVLSDDKTQKYLLVQDGELFIQAMEAAGKADQVDKRLQAVLSEYLAEKYPSIPQIARLSQTFLARGASDYFSTLVASSPSGDSILREVRDYLAGVGVPTRRRQVR